MNVNRRHHHHLLLVLLLLLLLLLLMLPRRAANFDPEELPQVMQYLHARGVKGYVTVNILVFDRELSRLEQRIRQIAQAGVDAVIVQVGAWSMAPTSAGKVGMVWWCVAQVTLAAASYRPPG
jgi:collagenase-like PrtC family protease